MADTDGDGVGDTLTPWSAPNAWYYPTQYRHCIPRADGSLVPIFIAELQASTWATPDGQGFVVGDESVGPLIQTAWGLGLDILFWRQDDLEGIHPSGEVAGQDIPGLSWAVAQTGEAYDALQTP